MSFSPRWRFGLVVVGALALGADTKDKLPPTATYAGKVVPLADLVAAVGTKLDADAQSTSLVLQGDDGKVLTLLKDEGSRMYFTDAALLKRPMRLTGRLLPGSSILQVLEARSVVDGKACDLYYWCDICSIRRYEKKICECCGLPMERREVPLAK